VITINLLPAQYRRRQRTPIRVFGLTMFGVVVAASSLAYAAYARFGHLTAVRSERRSADEEMEGLRPAVQYYDALLAEKADAEKRVETIREIRSSRILWTRKLDELAEIINVASDAERYTAWFDELSIEQNTEARGSGGDVKAKGVSGSDNFAKVAAFYQELEGHGFFTDFSEINNPTGKRSERDETLDPPQVWEFPLELKLKKREPVQAGKKGARPAAKPGPKPDAKAASPGGTRGR
jgi:Tfp pilus assembly protein PilN